jgi:hypothetical protein
MQSVRKVRHQTAPYTSNGGSSVNHFYDPIPEAEDSEIHSTGYSQPWRPNTPMQPAPVGRKNPFIGNLNDGVSHPRPHYEIQAGNNISVGSSYDSDATQYPDSTASRLPTDHSASPMAPYPSTGAGLRERGPKGYARKLPHLSIDHVIGWVEEKRHKELPGWSETKEVLSKREQVSPC